MIFAYRLILTGSPQQLPSVKPKFNEVWFSTPSTNSGSVFLSDVPVNTETETTRYAIPADTRFPFKVTDLSELYVDGTSGDYLDLICEERVKPLPLPKLEVKKYATIKSRPPS